MKNILVYRQQILPVIQTKVQFYRSREIAVDGVRLMNSPSWTLRIAGSRGAVIRGVTIRSPVDSENTDGIDVECSSNVLVEHADISVGDDALCVKAGSNGPGRLHGIRAENITLRHSVIGSGHGISIGSETSAGIRNVTFEHIRMSGTEIGVPIVVFFQLGEEGERGK